jgi:hypothetical protein
MAGQSGVWKDIGAAMDPAMEPAEIRRRLNSIVVRRNQIVHEGDYERLEKPRGPGRNSITHRAALEDIAFIARLVDAIHAVV